MTWRALALFVSGFVTGAVVVFFERPPETPQPMTIPAFVDCQDVQVRYRGGELLTVDIRVLPRR